jgi:hypothetical protein
MKKNLIDERIKKLINKIDNNGPPKKRIPSWVKKGIVGVGIALIPVTYVSSTGCISDKEEENEYVCDNQCDYAGPPICDASNFIDFVEVYVTFDGSFVDANVLCSCEGSDYSVEKTSLGKYEIQTCYEVIEVMESHGFNLTIQYEDQSKVINIPYGEIPPVINVELNK